MAIRYLGRVIGFSVATLLATTTHAEAAAHTVGDIMNNLTNSVGTLPMVAQGAAYLLGIMFGAQGIYLFKDHVDGGSGTRAVPLSSGIKKFLAGGMLLSLPYMAKAAMNNLVNGSTTGLINDLKGLHAAPGGNGTDQMIVAFINNIAQPASTLLMAFGYIAAIILLITGIIRLTHTAQEGPRGPTGLGTILTFIASGALFSLGDLMGTFVSSLFHSSATTSTFAQIGTNILADQNDVLQVAPVIEALMTFIMIVGFIAFIRGWFVLKSFGDGSQQASLAQALTFLIGGTMAINLGALVNAIENTLQLLPANSITFQ